MPRDGLAPLLFEIASEERLGILRALETTPLRHAELSARRAMTGSETTRHLNRLIAAGLVAKNTEGEYSATPLARALLQGLPFFDFLAAHHRFALTHDLLALPPAFVERLGELRSATFTNGVYHVVAVQENALRAVRRRIWVATEQRFEQALPILREKAGQGADVRVVRPRALLEEERRSRSPIARNFPLRFLPEVRLFLAVLDDQAGICFPSLDGSVDMATMLLVTDPVGYRWAEELFELTWSHAQGWPSPNGATRSPARGAPTP